MALNRLMHPQNIYKDRKPDFKGLAMKYSEFRQHAITDLQGKVHIDFKKPECLRALTWALLKDDWGLDVDLPLDRLIPTIPLRLNYLLWLEDLAKDQTDVRGIDIGTGASCVYPLLGAKKNKWTFLASEADAYSHEFATRNVEKNKLQDSIKVVKVKNTSGLHDLVTSEGSEVKYAFCMCNPPFFANNLEAWGLTSRSDDRPEPKGINTAAPGESVAPGGEVEFVRKMIQDSMKLRHTVRIYSSMLGKKTSLLPLKEELRKHEITNFGVTEFCQGRTMRWGLGWSFDPSVKFPDPPSKHQKSTKPKPPVVYKIPRKMTLQPEVEYSVPDIGSKVMSYLDELKVIYEPEKSTPTILEIQMVAVENTWSNQRRKRREKMRTEEPPPNKLPRSEDNGNVSGTGNKTDREKDPGKDSGCDFSSDVTSTSSGADNDAAKNSKCDIAPKQSEAMKSMSVAQMEVDRLNISIEEIEEYILKCKVVVKKVESDVVLEVTWEDGDNVELMHQVVQYFRNRLK